MPEYTLSDRGFKRYEPVETDYGHEVLVYESSSAEEPKLWLAIEPTERSAQLMRDCAHGPAHLTFEQAETIIATLQAAMRNHYQHG